MHYRKKSDAQNILFDGMYFRNRSERRRVHSSAAPRSRVRRFRDRGAPRTRNRFSFTRTHRDSRRAARRPHRSRITCSTRRSIVPRRVELASFSRLPRTVFPDDGTAFPDGRTHEPRNTIGTDTKFNFATTVFHLVFMSGI